MTDLARLTAALADRYRLERELGAGGMATVYLAEDLKHDRQVAIKVLKPELAAVLGAERFIVEIKTTAALSHPHILPLFDSGTADGFLYYVMPYIKGETIRDRLNRETQLGVDEAVKITREIADALDYAHRHGVIHRDIKPENILLHDGRAMVMDFGIALAVSAAAGGRMTETGLSLGTPHYMSPEQATAEKEITGRSDVYSLASVLYEMLAGQPPHVGGSAQQIIMKIIAEPTPLVTTLRKSVPTNVAAALARALEKLPADRFESAKAFADALANPAFTSTHLTDNARGTSAVRGRLGDWRSVAALTGWIAALGLLAWNVSSRGTPGPVEYDVGLPDSASMVQGGGSTGFAVAPRGDFVVYRTENAGMSELWYRSLVDLSVHRIEGTKGGDFPAISPDGRRVAFVRARPEGTTIETIGVDGTGVTSLGAAPNATDLLWQPDGRILLLEADGTRLRTLNVTGVPPSAAAIPNCPLPAPLPDGVSLLCSTAGGGPAFQVSVGDGRRVRTLHLASSATSPVLGSQFRLIGTGYVTYVANGDLFAAPIDLTKGTVGRPVRMASGIGVGGYSGAATYEISAGGSLVYAQGDMRSVGHLVRMGTGHLDTLPVGRASFFNFAISPDSRRLATTVKVEEGIELRVYDLATGQHVTWVRGPDVGGPIWSPTSDRILFSQGDSVMVGSPDMAGRPEFLMRMPGAFSPFTWGRDGRVVFGLWDHALALSLNVTVRPVTLDTIATNALFPRASADGHWLAYANASGSELLLEPLPRDGRRFPFASGTVDEAHWLLNTEIVFPWADAQGMHADRLKLTGAASAPIGARTRWLELAEYRDTPGQTSALSPDGRFVYLRGAPGKAARYLRVVPRWVERMQKAVDEANR